MYVGHAGLALLAKAKRPRLPLALLVALSFGPDWIEWTLGVKAGLESESAFLSHSLVSVAAVAALAVGVALLARRSTADALSLGALYLSHWVLDLVTGIKPTWRGGPYLGLALYDHRLADLACELVLMLLCAWVYLRARAPGDRRGWFVPAFLAVLQGAFVVALWATQR